MNFLLGLMFFFSGVVLNAVEANSSYGSLLPESKFSGYFKNETAYRFSEPRTYTKIRNTLYFESLTEIYSRHSLFVSGRAYHDVVYDVFDYDTIAARSERDSDQPLAFVETLEQERDTDVAEFREIYFDFAFDNFDLRLGKQFIVWGVIPGVRLIDEINPTDFRELILLDLLDYRIPLWSAKLDYYHAIGDFQFIWIPDIRFHKPAPRGSEWELLQEVPGTLYPEKDKLENSEVGFKYSFEFLRAQLALSYFFTWDDFPVIFRNVRESQNEGDAGETAVDNPPEFLPRYARMHMYGLSFTRPFFNTIVNSEFVYVTDKFFGTSFVDRDGNKFLDYQGALKLDHIRYGLSVDLNIFRTEISPGITLQFIPNYDPSLIQNQLDKTFNIFIRKKIEESSAVFELLGIYLVDLDEIYFKPRFTFSPADKVTLGVGLDLFSGSKSRTGTVAVRGDPTNLTFVTQSTQFLGNFDNNDRLFLEFKISF